MSGGYQNDIIIDCNSLSSIEAKGQEQDPNNSIYTNKVGVGVKVNPGDVISVHSGYISKRGAGGETIELTGKSSGKYITLTNLVKNEYQKQVTMNGGYRTNIAIPNYAEVVEEYGCVQYKEEEVKYELKDNEAHFNVSYYKTTNGEGYYHLPRRYDAFKSQFHENTRAGPLIQTRWNGLVASYGSAAAEWIPTGGNTPGGWVPSSRNLAIAQGNLRCPEDCFKNGRSDAFVYDMTAAGEGQVPVRPTGGINYYRYAYSNLYRRCLADIYYYPKLQAEMGQGALVGITGTNPDGTPDPSVAEQPYIPATCIGTRAETANFSAGFKKKNDNSRYTIFVKELSYFSNRSPRAWFYPDISKIVKSSDGINETKNFSLSRNDYVANQVGIDAQIWLEGRDPAMSEYKKYTETKVLKVDPGEYSPSDLASELTQQLNVSGKAQTILGAVGMNNYPTDTQDPVNTPDLSGTDSSLTMFESTQVPVSTYTESTTYKTFHTATSVSVEEKAFSDFCKNDHSYVTTDPAFHKGGTITGINYLSSYQCIGIKRPDLFLAGRKVMKELGFRGIGENNASLFNDGDYNGNVGFSVQPPDPQPDPPEPTRLEQWASQKPETNEVINGIVAEGPLHGGKDVAPSGGLFGWSMKQMINPFVARDLAIGTRLTDTIPTSWSWTEKNLKGLKEYFDVQGKYPDLFEGMLHGYPQEPPEAITGFPITPEYSRFLHINSHDTREKTGDPADRNASGGRNNWRNPLGTDFMIDLAPSVADTNAWKDIDHTRFPIEGDPETFFTPYPGKGGGGDDKLIGSLSLCGSNAIFFYFDKDRSDVASGGDTDDNLYYGLFKKETYVNPYSQVEEYIIAICPEKVGGIPTQLYGKKAGEDVATTISEAFSRTIGIDLHFSAYGTSAINLYAGQLSQQVKEFSPTEPYHTVEDAGNNDIFGDNYPAANKNSSTSGTTAIASTGYPLGASFTDYYGQVPGDGKIDNITGVWDAQRNARPLHQYLQKRYLGADNPSLSFDSTQSRFNFVDLHTPERVGNIVNAGSSADNPIVADTNDKVYFVNKRLLKKEFCPDMFPYQDLNPSQTKDDANPQDTTYSTFFNDNITPWSIMDADSGIFIEDFGFDNVYGLPSNSAPLTS